MRPHYGDAFRFGRLLNVTFYTTSTDKLLQARLLFVRRGYDLRFVRTNSEPYDESYEGDTEALLSRAIRQVNEEFGIRSVFFVEDTSIRLECLSEGQSDFPGMAAKEWFAQTTFDDLRRQIALRGGDDRVTVKSDIALHLPTLSRPILFHGETLGRVADSPPAFEESAQYPWLTPRTFNGWFIPNGSVRRLGAMEFEESLDFDFRARSINALVDRLEEMNAVLDLKPTSYTLRRTEQTSSAQLPLLADDAQHVVVVIGHRCAGKTTLGNRAAIRDDVGVFEASTVLRDIGTEKGVKLTTSAEALAFLGKVGMDAVAHALVEIVQRSAKPFNVISGIRTIEELVTLRRSFPQMRVLLVDADPRVRFERHIRRARDPEAKTYPAFQALDAEQARFGVMRVATDVAHRTIRNDTHLHTYLNKIDELFDDIASGPRSVLDAPTPGELHRCLRALVDLNRLATCEEISLASAATGPPVQRYNTNRALKHVPEFAERIERRGKLLSYKITDAGRTLLELLDIDQTRTSSVNRAPPGGASDRS